MGIKSKGKAPATRQQPLAQQLASDQALTKRARRSKADGQGSTSRTRPSDDARMLDLARSQLDEIAAEEAKAADDRGEGPSRSGGRDSDEEDDDEALDDDEEIEYYEELVRCRRSPYLLTRAQEIDEDDQAALDAFMPSSDRPRNLADLVMEKLDEHEQRGSGRRPLMEDDDEAEPEPALANPKVIEVYSKCGPHRRTSD